jgi:hypothetical protein
VRVVSIGMASKVRCALSLRWTGGLVLKANIE